MVLVEGLRARLKVPVSTWDERFTTSIAEQALIEGHVSRRERRDKVDQLAAVLILQSYLDYRKLAGPAGERAPERAPGRVAAARPALRGLARLAARDARARARRVGPPATLTVPPGAGATAIGQRLQALGYVRHPLVFKALVASLGAGQGLKAGEYILEDP